MATSEVFKIKLPLDEAMLERLRQNRFESVSIEKCDRQQARLLRRYLKTSSLTVWELSSSALNELIHVEGLTELSVQFLKGRGCLRGRSSLHELVVFCGDRKTSALDMATLRSGQNLKRLTWRSSLLGDVAVKHLAAMKNLVELDIEDSDFDDAHAAVLAKASCRVRKLHLANTKLTRRGLLSLMQGQDDIEDLDLWGTPIHSRDLSVLTRLSKLRRLSCGTFEGERHAGRNVIAALRQLPNLEAVELDRIKLSPDELATVRQLVPAGCWWDEEMEVRVPWPETK